MASHRSREVAVASAINPFCLQPASEAQSDAVFVAGDKDRELLQMKALQGLASAKM